MASEVRPPARSGSERARDAEANVLARGGSRKIVLLSPEATTAIPTLMREHGVTTFKALIERLLTGR